MKLSLTPMEFRECLIHIGCMSQKNFKEAFSEQGEYQFRKFRTEYKGDVGRWIGYLDSENLRRLFEYFEKHLKTMKG